MFFDIKYYVENRLSLILGKYYSPEFYHPYTGFYAIVRKNLGKEVNSYQLDFKVPQSFRAISIQDEFPELLGIQSTFLPYTRNNFRFYSPVFLGFHQRLETV